MAEREIFKLEELLKEYIVDEIARDPIEGETANMNKYKNLKITIDTSGIYKEPNFKVQIGMLEAFYTIEDCTKLSGALTVSDELLVRDWFRKEPNKSLLMMYWQGESVRKEKTVIMPFDME